MEKSSTNDKPVFVVKEDPPMVAKHFHDYLLPRFIHLVRYLIHFFPDILIILSPKS
jgi:hypothetical protein